MQRIAQCAGDQDEQSKKEERQVPDEARQSRAFKNGQHEPREKKPHDAQRQTPGHEKTHDLQLWKTQIHRAILFHWNQYGEASRIASTNRMLINLRERNAAQTFCHANF